MKRMNMTVSMLAQKRKQWAVEMDEWKIPFSRQFSSQILSKNVSKWASSADQIALLKIDKYQNGPHLDWFFRCYHYPGNDGENRWAGWQQSSMQHNPNRKSDSARISDGTE
jgi:hypothetical protein